MKNKKIVSIILVLIDIILLVLFVLYLHYMFWHIFGPDFIELENWFGELYFDKSHRLYNSSKEDIKGT